MAHVKLANYKDLHQESKPPGGEKGCLWEHQSQYKPSDHCSHRWQGRRKAEGDPTLYNYPAYEALCVDHAPSMRRPEDRYEADFAYRGKKAPIPSRYRMLMVGKAAERKRPRPGQWDLSNPANFANNTTKPYFHNAHHIVPNATLRQTMDDVGKTSDVIELMAQGLLRGDYNLNDKVNMIILPMDATIADAMGLPRHLKGHKRLKRGEKKQLMDHPDYRRRVGFMLAPIMGTYTSAARQALQDQQTSHETPPFRLSRKQLEEVSEQIYSSVKKARGHFKGATDDFRFGGFAGKH